MTIYIIPAGPDMLRKEYFEGKGMMPFSYDGGSPNVLFWNSFYDECAGRGVKIRSYLDWEKGSAQPDDILLSLNHSGETFFWRLYYNIVNFRSGGGFLLKRRRFFMDNYKSFARRVLLQVEPPVAMPYVYSHLAEIAGKGFYDRIFAIARVNNLIEPESSSEPERPEWEYFNYFEHRTKDITSVHFDAPKTKYLTMINSNVRPHKFDNELYGERLKAVKFFSGVPGFDFYGFGWDKLPRHPLYAHYSKYVKKTWRGKVPDKLKTMSEYKFGLAFENDITPGWISEKIFDCMAAGTVPVYYGAPDIEKSVPADCFIDFRKFMDYGKLHAYLSGMPENELAAYRERIKKFLKTPPDLSKIKKFTDNVLNGG